MVGEAREEMASKSSAIRYRLDVVEEARETMASKSSAVRYRLNDI